MLGQQPGRVGKALGHERRHRGIDALQGGLGQRARRCAAEQRQLWDKMVTESTAKLKASGVQFVEVDKKAFYEATKPVREKYGAKYAALIKRIEDTK